MPQNHSSSPRLRGRDWLGIVFLLIPVVIYTFTGLPGMPEIDVVETPGSEYAPRNPWSIGQVIAIVVHVPLWTIAVVLFISGRREHKAENDAEAVRKATVHERPMTDADIDRLRRNQ